MNRVKIIVVVAFAMLFAAAAARGDVSHALGAGGGPVKLYKDCGREPMYITPAGKVWQATKGADGKRFVFQMQNIDQAQIKCLIARVDALPKPKITPPPVNCYKLAGPPPTVTVYHGDDWKANNLAAATKGIDTIGPDGVDALAAWDKAVYDCETS